MSTAREILVLNETIPQILAPQIGVDTYLAPISLTDATGAQVAFDLQVTVNKAAGDDTCFRVNQIDMLSPGTSLLADFQEGGSSKFSVNNIGRGTFADGIDASAGSNSTFGTNFIASVAGINNRFTTGWGLADIIASATIPNLNPDKSDSNTGIGHAAADQLSVIAGGVEGTRWTENGGVLQTHQLNAGLTAFATGGQAGALALTSSYNEIAVVATTGDSVKVAPAVAGNKQTIINNGANSLDVFPDTGDDLGAGVDTAVALAAGSNITYLAFDATNWESV